MHLLQWCAYAAAVKFFVLSLQLRLPIQPPLALLAGKLAEGMLGLRWAKVKVGSGSNAVVKTVQANHTLSYTMLFVHGIA